MSDRIPDNLRNELTTLSIREIAELDGTHEDTVRRQIKSGTLKATKLSARRIGVRLSDYRAARGIA